MSELNEKLLEIKRQKDTYIIPQNLKKDVEVFGITGTYEGSGGSNDVKLFETITEMQQDPNPQEDDLALVYGKNLSKWTETTNSSELYFPNIVVLSTPQTSSLYAGLSAIDIHTYWYGSAEITPTSFTFSVYAETSYPTIIYESEDGITYTRTTVEDTINAGTDVGIEAEMGMWYPVFSEFMYGSSYNFGGLYKYETGILDKDTIYFEALSGLNINTSNNSYTSNTLLDIPFNTTKLINMLYRINITHSASRAHCYINTNNELCIVDGKMWYGYVVLDSSGNCIGIGTENSLFSSELDFTVYKVTNLDTMEYEVVRTGRAVNVSGANVRYYFPISDMKSVPFQKDNDESIDRTTGIYPINTTKTYRLDEDNSVGLYRIYNGYIPAKTQLTLSSQGQMLDGILGYGTTGIIEGNLGSPAPTLDDENAIVFGNLINRYEDMEQLIITDSNKDLMKNIAVFPTKNDGTPLVVLSGVTTGYNLCSTNQNLRYIGKIDLRNLASLENAFRDCPNLEKVGQINTTGQTKFTSMFSRCDKLEEFPVFDTSSATDICELFGYCHSLRDDGIPTLNTSNVTNMSQLFASCTSLVEPIVNFDFSHATSTNGTFADCSNLITIPDINISATKTTYRMFASCSSLITARYLDTSSNEEMSYMFYYCSSLENVPVYNTSRVTVMNYAFKGCPNLTNESLNNILLMCKNATGVPSSKKTLKQTGLTREQATICTTLSNYQAFTSAGWTTGY